MSHHQTWSDDLPRCTPLTRLPRNAGAGKQTADLGSVPVLVVLIGQIAQHCRAVLLVCDAGFKILIAAMRFNISHQRLI